MKFLSQEKTAAQRKSSSSRDVSGSPDMWRDLALIFPGRLLGPQLFLSDLCVKVLTFLFVFSVSPCLRGEILPGVLA